MDASEPDVAEKAAEESPEEVYHLPAGFKPHWHPVLLRGIKVHLPVRVPWKNYWMFKDVREQEIWNTYSTDLGAVTGTRSMVTGQPYSSEFIRELPPEDPPDLGATVLTMEGVAKLLGLSSGRSARGFVKRHGMPHSRIGRQYLVRRAAVETFIQGQESVARSGGSAAVAAAGSSAERLGPVLRSVNRHRPEVGHGGA